MIRSEITGDAGDKIVSFTPKNPKSRLYISISETKWQDERLVSKLPIWCDLFNPIPSLYIGKIAIYVDLRKRGVKS